MTHLQRIVESACSNERKMFKVGGSMSRGRPTETWSEVIRSELKEGKVSRDLSKDSSYFCLFST